MDDAIPTSDARPRYPTAKPDPQLVSKWWAEYFKTKSEESRNRLLENYLPVVKYTADRLHTKLPDNVDVNDLMSAGVFGLMGALKAYDPDRGVKFETYSSRRIRGAMLDELRHLDWVPRLVRHRTRKLSRARQAAEARLGRPPSEKELAKEMRLSLRKFRKLRKDAYAVGVVSLNRKWFETDSSKDVCEIDVVEDVCVANPFRSAQRRDIKDLVTRGLSRAEQLIIILYYFEEMTMKEIGKTLDLSESRISQMHSSILVRLARRGTAGAWAC